MSQHWKALLVTLVVCTGLGAVSILRTAGDPPRDPVAIAQRAAERQAVAPGDPLTDAERGVAAKLAMADPGLRARRTDLLYVQRNDDKNAGGRRLADAFVYDYADDRLTVRTIDVGRSVVVRTADATGVQPPPSREEETRAAELLLQHPKLGKGVRSSYAKLARRPLRSSGDLHLRGLIFSPDHVHDERSAKAVAACARHRCVRLFVRLPKGKWLDTSRIVIDLSAAEIQTLRW
jgi:hypothetical protein